MDQSNPNLSIEYIDSVAVAVPTDAKILDEDQIQALEKTFMPLIEQTNGIRLLIDFSNVQFLTSSVLGLLIRINRKVLQSEGRLRLCCIDPKILEIFKITRLDKVFELYQDRQQALEGF
ncbi:MAG TPA: STAS domain-containing protein [Anaerohalosphaeraceae bacterium]|jgi:anti-sigma B factor antagonist|nr:STAS domain-containing protein [Anaerohalosphaeraceae bacterium]